ncbi:hypothetical protein L6452_19281 [Arctium lappa]|uniref:Uncharacterized protein n=1 Tax=Arctium lappa TaxID=4217 RepID=A0ACB9B9D4_ARCLA|nr:hypothetical protein L6452_19281 [Arctium lappa]
MMRLANRSIEKVYQHRWPSIVTLCIFSPPYLEDQKPCTFISGRSEVVASACWSLVMTWWMVLVVGGSIGGDGKTLVPTTGSSASWKIGPYNDNSDMRMVIRHRDLTEIVDFIKEHFDKATDAGDQVSVMMETGRICRNGVSFKWGVDDFELKLDFEATIGIDPLNPTPISEMHIRFDFM